MSDDAMLKSEESFEDLLARVSPRPAPSADEVSDVRQAVYEEWQTVIRKRRTKKRIFSFAAAATVLIAIGILVNTTQVPQLTPVQVASIEKSFGAIYVLGEQSVMHKTDDLANIVVGQTIQTDKQSGLGLAWGSGGSLRVGAESRIHFVSADAIELISGAIYFDSDRAGIKSNAKLLVRTDVGVVAHLGTQYMMQLDGQELTVSVREGEVSIDGIYYQAVAVKGEQLKVQGSAQPQRTNFPVFGSEWEWIETTAPIGQFDGKTVYEFLQWVARETGFDLHYADDAVERVVKDEENILSGEVDAEPRAALRQRMLTADLGVEIDKDSGTIIISDSRN